MTIKHLFAALLALVAALPAFAQETMWVNAKSGLRIRETPDPKGKTVATVPYAHTVILTGKTRPSISKGYTIEGNKGTFAHVQYKPKEGLLLDGYAFDAFLQDEPPAPQNVQLYVVATSGLRFREKADANSAVLATIPFGDSVVTDGAQKMLWEIEEKTPEKVFKVENTSGFWQKVVYKGKKGYVFSGFVSQWYKPEIKKSTYVFLEEGYGCGDIVYNTADYNWFGWYVISKKTALKPVQKLSFSVEDSDGPTSIITRTDRTTKGDTARYIIGVRKGFAQQLVAGNVKGEWFEIYDENSTETYYIDEKQPVMKLKNTDWQVKINFTRNPANPNDVLKSSLILQTNDLQQKQTLAAYDAAKPYSDTNNYIDSASLIWHGDLDGDSKLDFILSQNNEGGGGYTLYLSTMAGKGQYVKKVGTIWGCGC
jgi:Bacterial SH3 domain